MLVLYLKDKLIECVILAIAPFVSDLHAFCEGRNEKKKNSEEKRPEIDKSSLHVGDIIHYWNNGHRTGIVDEINQKNQVLYMRVPSLLQKYSQKNLKRTKVQFANILKKE